MSYQPFPASGPPAAPPPAGRRSPVLLIVGIVVLVAGVVGGLILILWATQSTKDSVKRLGRAPAGCETTLDFDKTGTFLVFYERAGTIPDLGGDCSNSGSFERADDSVPDQTLTLTDSDGNDVDIAEASGVSYDAGGFKGEQIGKVTIDDAGTYTLNVSPDDAGDDSYAIAIGKDPTANESTLRVAGIAVLIAGVVIGALLIVLGARRRGTASTTPAAGAPAAWTPAAAAPATWPPVAQPAPPPFGAPPPGFGSPPPAPTPTPTYGGAPEPWPTDDPTRQQPQPPDPFSRPPGS